MDAKLITTQTILECLNQAIEKAIDRKRRLGQYAVIWEDDQIKELRFDESNPTAKTAPFESIDSPNGKGEI